MSPNIFFFQETPILPFPIHVFLLWGDYDNFSFWGVCGDYWNNLDSATTVKRGAKVKSLQGLLAFISLSLSF